MDWRTSKIFAWVLVYTGDHPGMRQERLPLPGVLPKGNLYVTLPEGVWVPLYPLVNVLYCPQCGSRETYFIDRADGPDEKPTLKSFERGHVFEDAEVLATVRGTLTIG